MAVARLHQVRKVGEQISAAWLDFVKDHPKALDAGCDPLWLEKEAKIDEATLAAWRDRLESLLGVEPQDGVTLKEAVEFVSPLHAPLWDAWRVCSRDPEQFIGQWAREGVPLGMDMEIPESAILPQCGGRRCPGDKDGHGNPSGLEETTTQNPKRRKRSWRWTGM